MNQIEAKKALRKQLKQKKDSYTPEQKLSEAKLVFERINSSGVLDGATTLLLYWSLPDELPTHEQVEALSKVYRVLLPVVVGTDLELRLFEGVNTLKPVPPYGILEPVDSPVVAPSEVDVAVIPAVGLDRRGGRLGRGKGFYDRLIPQLSHAALIGVCLQCQLVQEIPMEPHDRAMDWVFTPQDAYHTRG